MAQSHVRAPVKWATDHALGRVAEILGIQTVHAYGLITALTGALMERHKAGGDIVQAGSLRTVPTREIESAVQWDGEPGHFAAVVLDNYVDGRGIILHWMETAVPILKDRAANNARVAAYRQRMRESQDQRAEEFVNRSNRGTEIGTSVPTASRVQSASPSAPPHDQPPPASRPTQESTRLRAQPPAPAADQSAPHSTAPGVSVSRDVRRDTRSDRRVMGDTSAPQEPSPIPRNSYARDVENGSRDVDNVMGDSVMGDVMGDSHALHHTSVTHYSRAVVQDLNTKPDQEQSTVSTDLLTSTTHSTERASRIALKMTALTAALLGVPTEGCVVKDDLVAMYGLRAEQVWKTVARFVEKFYGHSEGRAVEVVNQLILLMSPEGIGQVRDCSPNAVLHAIVETTERPPRSNDAAFVFVMRKLESGKGNLELGSDGLTSTERASKRYHREDERISPAVRRVMDQTGLARRMVTTKTDEQRTALRWVQGSIAVKQEIEHACFTTFADWRPDLPGLDTVKANWIKAEALKRWRAAGRPLPMPPRTPHAPQE